MLSWLIWLPSVLIFTAAEYILSAEQEIDQLLLCSDIHK